MRAAAVVNCQVTGDRRGGQRAGAGPAPTAAIRDRQSVKTGGRGGPRVCGRIRHRAVDTAGWAPGDTGQPLAEYTRRRGDCAREVVPTPPHGQGFQVVPRRWVVERTFGWFNHWRRLAKDFERRVESAVTHVQIASIGLMLRRLAPA